jgi:medium-chain acyl-[acyl-carrier-protein] hydrolase
MEPFERKLYIHASDADPLRRLRISRLFTILQEAAIGHTEELGMGREKTLDRGFLWIVTIQQAKIRRMPRYDETVTLQSLPGKMMHTFFPRYTRLLSETGEELVSAAALWMLMDEKKRTMLLPDDADVYIEDGHADWGVFWPRPPRLPKGEPDRIFTVPYSYTDLNGHMNNTRYYDLAEDCMPAEYRTAALREVCTEYTGEALPGDEMRLALSAEDGEFRIAGQTEKKLFRISMRYDLSVQEGGGAF